MPFAVYPLRAPWLLLFLFVFHSPTPGMAMARDLVSARHASAVMTRMDTRPTLDDLLLAYPPPHNFLRVVVDLELDTPVLLAETPPLGAIPRLDGAGFDSDGRMVAVGAARPVTCDSRGVGSASGWFRMRGEWICGDAGGIVTVVPVDCASSYRVSHVSVVMDMGLSLALLTSTTCDLKISTNESKGRSAPSETPEHQFVSATGRPVDVVAHSFTLSRMGGQHLLDAVRSAVAIATVPAPSRVAGSAVTAAVVPTLDPTNNGTKDATVCAMLQDRHVFIAHTDTLHRLMDSCKHQLSANQHHALPPLPYSETLSGGKHLGGIDGPSVPHVEGHTELLEENVLWDVHLATSESVHQARAHVYQKLTPPVITRFDVETAVKHAGYREAAHRRSLKWLHELKHSKDRRGLADAVGHKLCVHSLEQTANSEPGGLRRDIGVTMGTEMQAMVTEKVMDSMRLAVKTQIIDMFVSPVVGIAQMFIIKPFAKAFKAFFNAIMPLLCYFLILILLHVLIKHGMAELPTAVDRPCGTIVVLFMTWPIVLTVVLVIYHRIGNYIYRSARLYVLGDLIPQIVEPVSHQLSHSLIHSVTTTLGRTMSHSLTHTLTHSLSNSVFHFYRCSYCYHYGDNCDLCFYFRDYSWQWRMAWQGNALLKKP